MCLLNTDKKKLISYLFIFMIFSVYFFNSTTYSSNELLIFHKVIKIRIEKNGKSTLITNEDTIDEFVNKIKYKIHLHEYKNYEYNQEHFYMRFYFSPDKWIGLGYDKKNKALLAPLASKLSKEEASIYNSFIENNY